MGSENRFDGIDDYATDLIRHKARRLVRRPEFSPSDQEDLEQEMVRDLPRRLPQTLACLPGRTRPGASGRGDIVSRPPEVAPESAFNRMPRQNPGCDAP